MAINRKYKTIEEFISAKPTVNTDYHSLSLLEGFSKIEFPVVNMLTCDYYEDLYNISVKVTLSKEEVEKYKYKPKLLARDIYDNPEIYYLILRLNNMYNIKDFDLAESYLMLIPKSELTDALTKIHQANINYINTYTENHKEIL